MNTKKLTWGPNDDGVVWAHLYRLLAWSQSWRCERWSWRCRRWRPHPVAGVNDLPPLLALLSSPRRGVVGTPLTPVAGIVDLILSLPLSSSPCCRRLPLAPTIHPASRCSQRRRWVLCPGHLWSSCIPPSSPRACCSPGVAFALTVGSVRPAYYCLALVVFVVVPLPVVVRPGTWP
jgi:hypothetical protein